MIFAKFKILIVSIIFIALIASCNCSENSSDDISWNMITGNWKSYKGVGFNENWIKVNDSTYSGIGFSLNNGDTAFMERIMVTTQNEVSYYSVYLSENSDHVKFRAVSFYDDNNWVFENYKNEFPQRIRYLLENDTTLTITISDSAENKKQMFYLRKER